MFSKKKERNQNIKVFVRVRPLNGSERNSKSLSVVEIPYQKEIKIMERPFDKISKTFTFDHVFGPLSKQIDVYNNVVHPLIEEVLAGYNCTVFAYGQTGTGKTFTMMGEKSPDVTSTWSSDASAGIIPRAIGHLLDELRILQVDYSVRVSFLELYNEEIFDLLSPVDDGNKIRLYEDSSKKGSVIINGLEEQVVHSKNEVFDIMERGSLKRQTAATLMNANSSRSHTVFSITVHIKENSVDGEELLKTGKLNLVDLAGSENIGRSGAVEKRAREAGNINQSLLTLGRVITSLVERAPHIPYRESKLTRLLQDSLGGRTKTSIIASISPASINLEETLSTLDYAHRAKNIQNRPEVNQKLSKKALLKEYTEEIDRLKRDLLATRERNGVYIDLENYQNMTKDLEIQKQEIAEKIQVIKALEKEKELKEALCAELHMSLKETEEQLKDSKQVLKEAAETVELQLEKQNALAEQTRKILSVTEESTSDAYKLHDKLDRKRSVEENNFRATHSFHTHFRSGIEDMENKLDTFTDSSATFLLNLKKHLEASVHKQDTEVSRISQIFESFLVLITNTLQDHSEKYSNEVSTTDLLIQELVTSTRGTSESAVTSLHLFMVDVFMPMCRNMQQLLAQHKSETEVLHHVINTKIQNQLESALAFSTMTKESWVKLKQSLDHYIQQSQEAVEKAKKASINAVAAQKKFDDAIKSKLDDIKSLIHDVEQLNEDKATSHSDHNVEMSGTFQLVQHCNDKINHKTISFINSDELSHHDFAHKQENLAETGSSTVNELTTKQATFWNSLEHLRSQLETSAFDMVSSEKSSWSHHSSITEKQIRKISENIRHMYQTQQEQGQVIEKTCQDSSEVHLDKLDQQRTNYASFIHEQLSLLESHSTYLMDWKRTFTSELEERNLDVEKFLSEDMHQDIATGNTPQRREFLYPSNIIMTSPSLLLEKIRRFNDAAQYKRDVQSNSQLPRVPSTISIGDQLEKSWTERMPSDTHVTNSRDPDSLEGSETEGQSLVETDNVQSDKENMNVLSEKSNTLSKEAEKRSFRKPLSSYN